MRKSYCQLESRQKARMSPRLLATVLLAVSMTGCAQKRSSPAIPDVVFVATPFRVVDAMLSVARVTSSDTLFDLGSGDGRIVIAAAKRYGIRAVGIDIDPRLVASSRVNADTARVSRLVDLRDADLFKTDLRSATVVTLYLLPALNVRLRPKLFAELRPGSRVVSHSFDMGDWKADSTLRVDARIIYYWMIPANVSGLWTLASEGATRELTIDQQYQRISIRTADGITADSAVLRGDSLAFTMNGARYTGVFRGNSITGSLTAGGNPRTWRADRRNQ